MTGSIRIIVGLMLVLGAAGGVSDHTINWMIPFSIGLAGLALMVWGELSLKAKPRVMRR